MEDPAEPAVSRAVKGIWDNAHISFDLIHVSSSPAGVWGEKTRKKMTTRHFQSINASSSLLQSLTTWFSGHN